MKKLMQFLLETDHKLIALARKYFVFVFGGGIGLAILIGVTFVLVDLVGFSFKLGYAIGLASAIVFNFVYHSFVTFRKRLNLRNRLPKFVLVSLIVVFLNWLISTQLEGSSLQIHYLIVIFFVTSALSVANYFANHFWVFRHD